MVATGTTTDVRRNRYQQCNPSRSTQPLWIYLQTRIAPLYKGCIKILVYLRDCTRSLSGPAHWAGFQWKLNHILARTFYRAAVYVVSTKNGRRPLFTPPIYTPIYTQALNLSFIQSVNVPYLPPFATLFANKNGTSPISLFGRFA